MNQDNGWTVEVADAFSKDFATVGRCDKFGNMCKSSAKLMFINGEGNGVLSDDQICDCRDADSKDSKRLPHRSSHVNHLVITVDRGWDDFSERH